VELKHGRVFQPYVHSVDKRRVNAWKDMQNIEHGFTDPNDPAKKRLMAQRDNLPRDIKEARQAITDGLTELVEEGVITSRDDVIQALTDGGFEIARETDKAISIKNPDPESKRNIRLTGGLYERDFNFSAEVQSTVTAASKDYRARSTERYDAAKQLYDSEIARKRDYHQSRHDKPRREQRAVTADVRQASTRFSYSPYNLFEQRPSPFNPRFKQTRKRESDNDSELRTAHYTADRAKRERNSASHQVKNRQVGNNRRDSVISRIYTRDYVGSKNERSSDLQVLSRQQVRSDLYATDKGLNSEQTAIRQNRASIDSTAGHDRATEPNARQQRQGYSSLEELIAEIDSNADRATAKLADTTRELEEHNQRAEKGVQWLGRSEKNIFRANEQLSERHNRTLQHSNSAYKAIKELSEYDSTRKQSIEQYRAVREQIERIAGNTEQNKQYAERNQQVATANTDGARLAQQLNKQVTEQLEQQRQQVRSGQGYRPRMR